MSVFSSDDLEYWPEKLASHLFRLTLFLQLRAKWCPFFKHSFVRQVGHHWKGGSLPLAFDKDD